MRYKTVVILFLITSKVAYAQGGLITTHHTSSGDEAVRIVKSAPPWKPAKHRGQVSSQRIVLPINFKLG
jgi:hypothetical protein